MSANAILPVKLYVKIWAALMFLLVATWGVAQIHLGVWNLPVALAIAIIKMFLVILVFMHVKYSSRLTWLFAAAGFIWLVIMIDLTMSDFLTRRMVPTTSANVLLLQKQQTHSERKGESEGAVDTKIFTETKATHR